MPAQKVVASILFVQTISSMEVGEALLSVSLMARFPFVVLVLADQRCNSYKFLLFKISSSFQFPKLKSSVRGLEWIKAVSANPERVLEMLHW